MKKLILSLLMITMLTGCVSEPVKQEEITTSVFEETLTGEKNDVTVGNASLEKIDINYEKIKLAEKYMRDGQRFFRENGDWVTYSEYNDETDGITLDEYRKEKEKEYSSVFTKRMISNIPKPDENEDVYIYSIGFLSESRYSTGIDRGTDISYGFSDWEIESVSENEIILVQRAFYFSSPEYEPKHEKVGFENHILMNLDNGKEYVLKEGERCETYRYRMVIEDGEWKFDSFSLWN